MAKRKVRIDKERMKYAKANIGQTPIIELNKAKDGRIHLAISYLNVVSLLLGKLKV
jgi:hypothetical protein